MAEKTYVLNRPNFLGSEVGLRTITYTFDNATTGFVTENGRKILKAGTIYPANDATAVGIIFEDADITDGDAVGSLMVGGVYIKEALPVAVSATAKPVFQAKGLFEQDQITVTVPADGTYA